MKAVCSINYIDKQYPVTEGEQVASLHLQVEEDFKAMAMGAVQGVPRFGRFSLTNYRDSNVLNKAKNARTRVNNYYEKPVVFEERDSRNIPIFVVNVADAYDARKAATKGAMIKAARDPYVVIDGEVMVPDDAMYQRKAVGLENVPMDTLDTFIQKAQAMQNIFTTKGVDVYVMLDGDQTEPGQVLAENSRTVKNLRDNGTIGDSTKVIAVNPNLLFEDVITHEFSHIFIDAIGGMKNTRVLNAYNKLIGSDVYNRVVELYPELDTDSDKFKKEVLATAMGMESAELFSNPTEKTWWDRFTEWLYNRVGSLFGFNADTARSLSQSMLEGNFEVTSKLSADNYFMKAPPVSERQKQAQELKDKLGVTIKNMQDANKHISINIKSLVREFERRRNVEVPAIPLEQSLKEYREKNRISEQAFIMGKLKTITQNIAMLNNNHSKKAALDYVLIATEGIDRNERMLKAIRNDMANDPEYDLQNAVKFLESIELSFNSFEFLNNLRDAANTFGFTVEEVTNFEQAINNALKKQNESRILMLDVARELLTRKLAPMEDFIRAEYAEQFELEYNRDKNNPTGRVRSDESKEDFVQRMLLENEAAIKNETEIFLRSELEKSVKDVGDIEFYLRSEKSMNSTLVRMTSKLLDRAEYKYTRAFLEKRADAQPIFEEYFKKYGSVDMKKMWGPLIQEADDEVYLISKYDYEFFRQLKALRKRRNDLEQQEDADPNEIKAAQRALYEFEKENTIELIDPIEEVPHKVPTKKWLNKNYAAIMSNPNSAEAKMLSFLEKTLGASDVNYENNYRLGRSPYGNVIAESAVYYRLPSMGRDTLEKAVGGDIIANAKDSLERLYRYKDDDPERFPEAIQDANSIDGFDSDSFKKVMSDTGGNQKYSLPIYMRGKFDKKTSTYDVMTAIMSDHYMSLQYKEKKDLQPWTDILTFTVRSKTYGETSGLKDLNMFTGNTAAEARGLANVDFESKEARKITSMIENRMYNITTTDAEFGKIAQTMMAWTGSVMMSLNFYSGIANVMQGKVMNWLESVGGNFYDGKNLRNGEKKFFADMGGWMDDLGKANNNSKTRLLIDTLNVQGDFLGLKERYIRSSRGLALASRKSLTAPNAMGEFYVQSTLMYSLMDKIKVKDKNGNYLDKNFKPTKDINKAVSLDESITVVDGKLKMHESVFSTTFSPNANGDQDLILEETRSYVKKVSSDLHGQYDDSLAPHFQRSITGKFVSMFKKWLVPGFDKRFRNMISTIPTKSRGAVTFDELREGSYRQNRFFSSDLKQFQEGRYTTFVRMMQQLIREGEALKMFTFSLGQTGAWENMTDAERSNVRQTIIEFCMFAATIGAAHILLGLASDLPEDDPMYDALMVSAFAFRRLHTEMVAYVNPLEAYQLLKSPAASVSLLGKGITLSIQVIKDGVGVISGEGFEEYERGNYKGQYKLQKYFFDVVPIANQLNRNLEDVTTYVFQTY